MGLSRKLDVFSKEAICAHLAKLDVPVRPAYELRKVTMLSTADPNRYCRSLCHATKSPREVIDPPTGYFDQWSGYNGFAPKDALMERLTHDDEALLYSLLGLEDGHLYFVAWDTNKFDACCKVLGESEQKPAWDLVRVMATDSLSGYNERQAKYEQLLSFELEIKILKGQVLELAKGIYQLPKTLEISNKDDLDGYSGYIQIMDVMGYRLRDHWMNVGETANGLTRIELEHGIEDIIEDALIRGELPIYQPILKKVDYSSHDRDKDLVFWPELKFVLEQKMGRTYPYHPFIENDRPDNANNQAGVDDDKTIPKQKIFDKREESLKTWLIENKFNSDTGLVTLPKRYTLETVYTELCKSNPDLFATIELSSFDSHFWGKQKLVELMRGNKSAIL